MTDIKDTAYYKYADDVIKGVIPACKQVIGACRRFFADLENPAYVFRSDVVERALKKMSFFRHSTGMSAGARFNPEPWQVFVYANLLGFYRKDGKTDKKGNLIQRKYNSGLISIGRKNGKTYGFCGALGMYFLLFDKEPNPEVALVANSREQARDVDLKCITDLCKNLDPGKKILKPQRNRIKTKVGTMYVCPADASVLDGKNVSFSIIDEYHEAKNSKVLDTIRQSSLQRVSPLNLIITTAGYDKSLPCYKLHEYATQVLEGKVEDDAFFAIIYTLDEDDDWRTTDPDVLKKANPNLGVTIMPSFILDERKKAIQESTSETSYRTKLLNCYVSTQDVWLQSDLIRKNMKRVEFESFTGCNVYVGVDLSAVSDLTVLSFLFRNPVEGTYYFKNRYYLPSEALETKQNRDLYALWYRNHDLVITPGNVTDYDFILNDLKEIAKTLEGNDNIIQAISYDSWNATQFIINATNEGFPCEPYSQSLGSFNRPVKEFERQLRKGGVVIDTNDATEFCFSNCMLKTDSHGNSKPFKASMADSQKIDGVIAILMGLGKCLEKENYVENVGI